MRKEWDDYFLDLAFQIAERSTCRRRHVGALVVKNNRIKGTGYNGSPPGLPHCIDEGCAVYGGHCVRCIHAEVNALMECTPEERKEGCLYCTDRPCPDCQLLIISSGIKKVVYGRPYPSYMDWFKQAPWVELLYLPKDVTLKD